MACRDCEEKEEYEHHRCVCCCQEGPEGAPGLQGEQGLQGVPGQQGIMGARGLQGPRGLQGEKGDPGVCICDDNGTQEPLPIERYVNVFAVASQSLGGFGAANDTVLFQQQNAVSASDYDLSMMAIDGSIKFLKRGIYYINWGAEARIAPPIPVPVPSFGFALFIDHVLVPGSLVSGHTQAPEDDIIDIDGEVTIEVQANAVLKLRNVSSSPIDMTPSVTGIQLPIVIASLNVHGLKNL